MWIWRKMQRISWTEKKTNESVRMKIGIEEDETLQQTVLRRKLRKVVSHFTDNYGWATCPRSLYSGLRSTRTCDPLVTRHRTYSIAEAGELLWWFPPGDLPRSFPLGKLPPVISPGSCYVSWGSCRVSIRVRPRPLHRIPLAQDISTRFINNYVYKMKDRNMAAKR